MIEQTIDLDTEIGEAPLSGFHLRFATLIGAALFLDGYDLFNAGYVAPYIQRQWQLQPPQLGLMLSIGLAGLAAGALIQGPFADRFGRRRIMIGAIWMLGLANLALATIVDNFVTFCVLRLLLGLSLGMISPLAFVYINEWAPARCANRYATLAFTLPFSLGGIAAGIAGIALTPPFGWRALYAVGILAIPIALLCHAVLPESIRYAAARKQWRVLIAILARARPDQAERYARAGGFRTAEAGGASPRFSALFDPTRRRLTLTIWIASALSLFCLHGLSAWLPTIILHEGAAVRTAFGYGTLLMTMQIVGGAMGGWCADRFGQTAVMAGGFCGAAVSIVLLALTIRGDFAFIAVAGTGFFVFGAQAVMNNFTAMSYDTHLRSTAVGAAVAFSRIGGMFGPLLIGFTQATRHGLWATLIMLAVAQTLAALVITIRPARPVLVAGAPAS